MKPEQITAWALSELSDDDRARIEAEIQESVLLQEQAKDTQAFCSLLTQTLGSDEAALTPEQRQALLASVPKPEAFVVVPSAPAMNGKHSPAAEAAPIRSSWRRAAWIGIGALAACWASYVGIAMLAVPEKTSKDRVTAERQFKVLSERVDDFAKVTKEAEALSRKSASTVSPLQPAEPKWANVDELSKVGTGQVTLGTDILDASGSNVVATNGTLSGYVEMKTKVGGFADDARPTGDVIRGSQVKDVFGGSYDSQAVFSGQNGTGGRTDLHIAEAGKDSFGRGMAGRAGSTVQLSVANPTPDLDMRTFEKASPVHEPAITLETSTERYASIQESRFLDVTRDPLSTFGIDVDSASFANVRRFLNAGQLPPVDAVRLEELINYFPYNYEAPGKDAAQPFSVQVDMAEAPWASGHRLARIGIKGREIGQERQQANLVFLVDVSGSMEATNKLALVKRSLRMLTEQLKDEDFVSIVTYAGSTEVKLASTPGKDKAAIIAVVDAMQSGGSTNGAAGIQLAYAEAQKHFVKEGINRVVLCTDGDFNVGVSSPEALEGLIKEKAAGGVFLSVLGFGTGNLQDRTMMTLADKGNGNYAYIDSLSEARKVLVEQLNGTLVTIAKDVKIQVEFNPAVVRSYRLIGYEKRALAKEDFNNDRKDAGEIGAGHTITALYEVVPVDAPLLDNRPLVDDLKYQPKDGKKELPALVAKAPLTKLEGLNDEVMTVKLRYKAPDGELSKLMEVPVKDAKLKLQDAPKDFQFAAAVAGFGLMLRDSENRGTLTWDQVRKLAISGKGEDPLGYRGEFIQLIDKANGLSGRP